MTTWARPAKIAFVGSHGVRKTTAAHAFASTMQRAGRSVEYGREVIRDNPLPINEVATGEAQLWVLVSQIRQELELAPKAEVLVTDRAVVDNYAYYLRACGMVDRFDVEPLVRTWTRTYDLVVRLQPDVALRADRMRSTSDAFRAEIERILDDVLPRLVPASRLSTIRASAVTDTYDWWPLAERLSVIVGEPLLAEGVARARRPRRPAAGEVGGARNPASADAQLELKLGRGSSNAEGQAGLQPGLPAHQADPNGEPAPR